VRSEMLSAVAMKRNPREQTPTERFTDEVLLELNVRDSPAGKRRRRLIIRLVQWTTAQGIPLERELIFDPDTIERFVEVGLARDRSRPPTARSCDRSPQR